MPPSLLRKPVTHASSQNQLSAQEVQPKVTEQFTNFRLIAWQQSESAGWGLGPDVVRIPLSCSLCMSGPARSPEVPKHGGAAR
jgi:hypothetical protein